MNRIKHLLVLTTLLVATGLHSQIKDSLAIKYARSITEQNLFFILPGIWQTGMNDQS